MLNSIGLQGPGIDAFVADHLPRLGGLTDELWVSVGGFSAADYAVCCERLDGDDRVAAIELNLSCPNVEEAPETAAQLVAAARAATTQAALREALPGAVGRRRRGPRRRRRRAPTASRSSTRSAGSRSTRTRSGRGSRGRSAATPARRSTRSRWRASTPARRPSTCPSWAWAASTTGLDALELVAVGATAVALGTVLFADPLAPGRIRAELDGGGRGAWVRDTSRRARGCLLSDRKKPCKLRKTVLLDSSGRGC